MTEQLSNSAIVVFDIDGVIRDVGGSYRRALADTVEHFTAGGYRPTPVDIDKLKSEGIWNNDWEASQELIYRYFEASTPREQLQLDYNSIVAFFQSRYRGSDPDNWTGYICNEPLLLQPSYLEQLTLAGIKWGFFSGATRASANYVLSRRLGLKSPVLVAMEDAPGKPDPTGLLATVRLLESPRSQVEPGNANTVAPPLFEGKAEDVSFPGRTWEQDMSPRSPRSQLQAGNTHTPAPPLFQGDTPAPPLFEGGASDLSFPGSTWEQDIDKLPAIVYVGDTVADMYTVQKARSLQPLRTWIAVGVLPPHVQLVVARRDAYAETLLEAGADVVYTNVQDLTPARIQALL